MSRLLVLGVIASLVTLSGCSSQAPAPCQIQGSAAGPIQAADGRYTVKLTNTGTPTANCPATVGDQWYIDNFQGGLIAIRSVAVDPPDPQDPNSPVYGKGNFSSFEPDANDLCTVSTLKAPFRAPPNSSTNTYTVQDLAFLSTALYVGSEFKASVTLTVGTETCTYTAQGIQPTIPCASTKDCNPGSSPDSVYYPLGSGVNNLYDQGCNLETWVTDLTGDPATGLCFFNKEFPSLGGYHP